MNDETDLRMKQLTYELARNFFLLANLQLRFAKKLPKWNVNAESFFPFSDLKRGKKNLHYV